MKVSLAIIFFTALAAAHAYAQTKQLTLNTWFPTEQQLSADMLKTQRTVVNVFKYLDIELAIENKPPERSIREANNGTVDGEFMRISNIDALYPNLLRVPQPIGQMDFVVLSARNDIDLSEGWQGLSDYKIGYVTGWKIVEEHVADFEMSYPVGNAKTLFSMLAGGRFDLIIYSKSKGLVLLKQLGLDGITVKSPALSSQQMYLFVHQKHQLLVPQLSQAIKMVTLDFTPQEMTSTQ